MLLVVIGLLATMLRFRKDDYQGLALSMARKQRSTFEVLKPCPLCGSLLKRGETVRTKVIEIGSKGGNQMGVKESIAHVLGCPYCWPGNAEHARQCPACKVKLTAADYVIARYFEKEAKKNHLHVLGCTICRKS
jgi:hypothetical protein